MTAKKRKHIPIWITILLFFVILAGIPFTLVIYQSLKSGLSIPEVAGSLLKKGSENADLAEGDPNSNPGDEYVNYPVFLEPQQIGNPIEENPMISHLKTADMNSDGLPDIIVADAQFNIISVIVQESGDKGLF